MALKTACPTKRVEARAKKSRPISRVLSPLTTVAEASARSGGNHSSRTAVTDGLQQPTRVLAGRLNELLFGLAPGGVYLATTCYHVCGALLPHPFTLTKHSFIRTRVQRTQVQRARTWRSTLCCTVRGLTPPRGYLAPCPLEPGLSSRAHTSTGDCLADSAQRLRFC